MFDCVKSIQFVIIVVCVRVKASVCKCVYEDIVMHVIFKWDVFEVKGCVHRKKGVVFCELRQDRFEFVMV